MKEIIRKNIAGIWSSIPTPFTENLELDTESVSRLVEHHVRLGIKGLFLSSVIGEGLLMSNSMKIELAAEVVKSNKDRMLLSMLIVDNPAKLMIDNIKGIKDIGIDIAVIGFPFTPIDVEEGFLRELFVKILGYTLNPEPNFNLTTELKNEKGAKKNRRCNTEKWKSISCNRIKRN